MNAIAPHSRSGENVFFGAFPLNGMDYFEIRHFIKCISGGLAGRIESLCHNLSSMLYGILTTFVWRFNFPYTIFRFRIMILHLTWIHTSEQCTVWMIARRLLVRFFFLEYPYQRSEFGMQTQIHWKFRLWSGYKWIEEKHSPKQSVHQEFRWKTTWKYMCEQNVGGLLHVLIGVWHHLCEKVNNKCWFVVMFMFRAKARLFILSLFLRLQMPFSKWNSCFHYLCNFRGHISAMAASSFVDLPDSW